MHSAPGANLDGKVLPGAAGHFLVIPQPVPNVHATISALREIHPDMPRWGLNGGCFRFYLALKQVFPSAVPYYDGTHVITRIGDAYFDVRGEVKPVSEIGAAFIPMDPLVFNRAYDWAMPAMTAEAAMVEKTHG